MNCYCSVKSNMKSFKLKEIEVKLAKKSLKCEERQGICDHENFHRKVKSFRTAFWYFVVRALSRAKKFFLKGKFNFLLRFFLHEVIFVFFWRRKRNLFYFFGEKLLGRTLCKMVQIFPPKVLVYVRKICQNNFLWKMTS